MKKTIRKVTLIALSLTAILLYKAYLLPQHLNLAQTTQTNEKYLSTEEFNEETANQNFVENEIAYSSPNPPAIDNSSYAYNLHANNEVINFNTTTSNAAIESNTQQNIAIVDNNTSSDFEEKKEIANNEMALNNSTSLQDFGYATASHGPNINNALQAENTVVESISAATNFNAARTASTYNAPSASRIANSSISAPSISFSSSPPLLVESSPGSPNNGSDPYVPIDDYYGLFALLLCAGIIFWYRMKANKLITVKV